jgi:hypothetical protein
MTYKMKTNKRTLFLLVLLLLVGAVGYPMIKGNISSDILVDDNSPLISPATEKILSDVRNTELDASILNSSELSMLNDFTLPLINIPVGRENPFIPVR